MSLVLALALMALLVSVFLYAQRESATGGSLPLGPQPGQPRISEQSGARAVAHSEKAWLIKLFLAAWLVRLLVVIVINTTGAIQKLGLSSDSLHYARMPF